MRRSFADGVEKAKIRNICHILVLSIASLCGTGVASNALAQDWMPPRCCPKTDCQQAASTTVIEVRGGFSVEGVLGVVSYDDPRVQPSLDGKYYVCIGTQARPYMEQTRALRAGQKKRVKCLFVPLIG